MYKSFLPANNLAPVISFGEARISASPEETDVVHDLLAFLAGQMNEMNKSNRKEISGFISWLEQELGVKIDTLSQKGVIEEFYLWEAEAVISVLKKNKKKIALDPSRRTLKEKVETEMAASKAKLMPLLSGIKATDDLIDQIVYRLYGLTAEEIEVGKKSVISGAKK